MLTQYISSVGTDASQQHGKHTLLATIILVLYMRDIKELNPTVTNVFSGQKKRKRKKKKENERENSRALDTNIH
jgi:hypothetical protein